MFAYVKCPVCQKGVFYIPGKRGVITPHQTGNRKNAPSCGGSNASVYPLTKHSGLAVIGKNITLIGLS